MRYNSRQKPIWLIYPEKALLEDRKETAVQTSESASQFLWVKKVDLKPETLFRVLIIRALTFLGLEMTQKVLSAVTALFLASGCEAGLSGTFIP